MKSISALCASTLLMFTINAYASAQHNSKESLAVKYNFTNKPDSTIQISEYNQDMQLESGAKKTLKIHNEDWDNNSRIDFTAIDNGDEIYAATFDKKGTVTEIYILTEKEETRRLISDPWQRQVKYSINGKAPDNIPLESLILEISDNSAVVASKSLKEYMDAQLYYVKNLQFLINITSLGFGSSDSEKKLTGQKMNKKDVESTGSANHSFARSLANDYGFANAPDTLVETADIHFFEKDSITNEKIIKKLHFENWNKNRQNVEFVASNNNQCIIAASFESIMNNTEVGKLIEFYELDLWNENTTRIKYDATQTKYSMEGTIHLTAKSLDSLSQTGTFGAFQSYWHNTNMIQNTSKSDANTMKTIVSEELNVQNVFDKNNPNTSNLNNNSEEISFSKLSANPYGNLMMIDLWDLSMFKNKFAFNVEVDSVTKGVNLPLVFKAGYRVGHIKKSNDSDFNSFTGVYAELNHDPFRTSGELGFVHDICLSSYTARESEDKVSRKSMDGFLEAAISFNNMHKNIPYFGNNTYVALDLKAELRVPMQPFMSGIDVDFKVLGLEKDLDFHMIQNMDINYHLARINITVGKHPKYLISGMSDLKLSFGRANDGSFRSMYTGATLGIGIHSLNK